ncbi:hypothetical protein PMAYCL1PPCAC_10819, partial [Pristionchus mayeri]
CPSSQMRNFTLDPFWHSFMPAYQRSVGALTLCLSSLAIYLMMARTHKTAKHFVKYLILLQSSITLVDVTFGFLSCPIFLFPAPGSLYNGIICAWFGFSGHVALTAMMLSFSFMSISVLYCFHYKHASIKLMTGKNSISITHRIYIRTALFAVLIVPGMMQVFRYKNGETGPSFIKNNFPSLYYLFQNPDYHAWVYDPAVNVEYEIVFVLATLFVS